MPARGTEQVVGLRHFDGTNLLIDSIFLGPTYLRRSQNWYPNLSYRLEKRQGATAYPGGDPGSTVRRLFATTFGGHRYLFAIVTNPSPSPQDFVMLSIDEAAWATVSGGIFATAASAWDMDVLNDDLYVGNGIDPVKRIPLATITGEDLTPIVDFVDGSAAATLTSDPGAQLLSGTYSYAWAIFDTANARWVERGTTRMFTVRGTGDQAVSVPTPTGMTHTLSASFTAHLFVSPVDYPIEFSHDQTPQGLDGTTITGPIVLRQITADGPPIPLHSVTRQGAIFRGHKGRLFLAGDTTQPNVVWASSILVPGNEQAIYNLGVFFPYNARTPRLPEPVTGLGLASTGERSDQAIVDSPLVILTLTRTYLFYGDILDDPEARLQLVSRRAGTISAQSVVETPLGLFYCGLESVYWVQPGGSVPRDVGWPIRPAILGIPVGSRANVTAVYHKGFYKLAIVPPGQINATDQWWLDLRQGVGQVPSWWGPQQGATVTCFTTTPYDPAENDRGYHATIPDPLSANRSHVEAMLQPNVYTENAGRAKVISVGKTGDIDDNAPFDRKIDTRLRAIGFPARSTSMAVLFSVDGGGGTPLDPMQFTAAGAGEWSSIGPPLVHRGQWNTMQWATQVFTEAQVTMPADRPRGRTMSLQFTHSDAVALAIRDLEFVYLPVPRPTRSLSDDGNT